ncbi:MAG: copper resistance system multicopper oxidase [Reyranella sp.]|uniref:copper resistance system multicopper oxidase n=1 Tax=Reyranella sp. TaxID=1929291 RepID=UPI001ACC5628|nr:copper resistance system multicopper oxidase [Reyranella sp.]MBN9086402.1 copper resistance system multicopper oxidase [Reyranella sp.]
MNRRRFVEGLAATGLAALAPARASADTRVDLTVGTLPANITGRPRTATVVNGSLPGPILRFREGDAVTIDVRNTLRESTSIHWHGLYLPSAMDGVPGLSFPGIAPGETFTYRFPIRQAGTYWYHSHSGTQEQAGLYGALILEPRGREPYTYQRDHVVLLTDWSDEEPMTIVSNLKQQGDYYNRNRRTLGTFIEDTRRDGLGAAADDRLMWGKMRMSPTDIADVTGATYTFLMNGQPPAANWTALFTPGENVRLRFINGSSMTTFDVRIPGLDLRVVQADGSDVEPVTVEEFRIGVAETYDVIVRPRPQAYTIFAQAQDRSGYARGTLAFRSGMEAAVPPLDPPPLRTMADMGMSHEGMSHEAMGHGGMDQSKMDHSAMDHSTMDHAAMGRSMPAREIPVTNADGVDPRQLAGKPSVDNVAMAPKDRLGEAGTGLDGNGRRVLTYRDLRALAPRRFVPPERAIEFHITGNMERWMWGFNGKKFSEARAVRVRLGERVRFVMINDTMMEHPIHLHGYLFEVENGQGDRLPLKHTVNVKPGERMSFVFTADAPGHWAFHCHLLYHMEMGMFRTVLVS